MKTYAKSKALTPKGVARLLARGYFAHFEADEVDEQIGKLADMLYDMAYNRDVDQDNNSASDANWLNDLADELDELTR